ncbi:MAG: hypothetical protein WKF58_19385 [Ilumatobacteraceae bacterium]
MTALADESTSDYWSARRRRATAANPSLTGPDYNGWRRAWVLSERRQLGIAGLRRRQKRRWPNLDSTGRPTTFTPTTVWAGSLPPYGLGGIRRDCWKRSRPDGPVGRIPPRRWRGGDPGVSSRRRRG